MPEDKPKRKKPGPSIYDLRQPATPSHEPRTLAETDRDGVLRWRDDWKAQATGWLPLDRFLRGRGQPWG